MKLLIFRTILIYLCVLFAMRLMGKRQLGELQPEELVSTILISNLASISIESEDVPVTASLIPLFLIAALELLGSALSFRSQKFFNLLSGRPKTVILNGEIDQNALRTLRLTVADLMEALPARSRFHTGGCRQEVSTMKLLIFRTILIYLCVLFAMRLMGKRQLGELQPEELVSTILISNLASISIESEDVPVTASLIPLFLIAALELLGSALSFRSQKFFNLLSGRPKTVILNGEIDQNALRTLRLTVADLMEALRGKDVFDPRDVSYAVIETNGTLSVALRPEKEPARLSDLQLRVEHCHATIPFVLDGQVLEDNLHWCGKDRAWLERTAQANTLLPQEILLLVGNETEDYFLLKKERRATVHEGRK